MIRNGEHCSPYYIKGSEKMLELEELAPKLKEIKSRINEMGESL